MATILVVEDEDALRRLAAVILQTAGYEVITASNGVEGVALFRSSPDQFSVVLTDLRMPVMNGQQLVKLVQETNPRAKIICMSGYTDEDMPAGTVFLQKPFSPDALRARVSEALKREM